MVNTKDHHPAHAHVTKGGKTFLIALADTAMYESYGNPTASEVRAAEAIVEKHLSECWKVWRTCHG